MKKTQAPIVFRSNKIIPVTFQKDPQEMSEEELASELVKRMVLDEEFKASIAEKNHLLHELETHQLELEIQNRELIERHRDIQELNKKYIDLYDFAPVGYLTLDSKGTILELNLAAAQMLETEKANLIGKNINKWVIHEDKPSLRIHIADCFSVDEKKTCEIELQIDQDRKLQVELHSTPGFDDNTQKVFVKTALIDVTERAKRKSAEAESKFLREERELREKFISTLSHDIRTPLTSSKLCAQMLNGAIDDIDKKKRLYELMVEELERADRMIRELLDASRITNGGSLPLNLKKCDLHSLAQKCISNIHSVYPDRPQVNLRVTGDLIGMWSRDGIYRVIENLLSNATKYGANDLPITVSLEDKGTSVEIIVHNHGDPIPLKEQKKIFEAFHRTDSARQSDSIGWGLGLSLVHSIIQRHDGSIVLRSTFEEGTSFVINLPKKIT